MKKILLSSLAVLGMATAFAGTGTKDNPYNIDDVQGFESKLTKDTGIDNVYVEGFIVGYMPANNTNLGNAVFSATNAVNTNLVLGGWSGEDEKDHCITVQLPSGKVRTGLNLASNPQNLGHKVLLHGNLRLYCGAPGIKDVDSYEWLGEAPEAGDNTNSGYLSSGLDDFTINNVNMASELTYVWTWDSNGGYAKASAYKDGKAYSADSYLISPEITLDANTTTASFSQAINFLAGNNRADFINVYVREGASGEWNVASVSTWPAGTDWTFVDSQIDLSAYAGKKIQIAFRYISNGEFSSTWEVKNLVIGGTASNPGTPTETWTVAEALSKMAAGFEGEAQVKGYITSIEEINTSFGNATYFISDDTNASNSLEVYRGYGLNGEKFTSSDQLAVGAEVVVAGKLVNYNGTYEFTTGSKIVSYNGSTGGGGGNDNPSTPGETPKGTCIAYVADGYTYTGNAVQVVTISGTQEEGNTMMDHPWVAQGVCSLSFTNNNNNVSYVTGGVVRWYKNDEITITPEEDIIVKGLVMSSGSTNPVNPNGSCALTNVDGKAWTATGNTIATWEGSMNTSFTFGNNAQVRWQYLEVYYTDISGVEEILAADDSEAVYFNLQGQKVNNPERGIFIKVVGSKAVKVIK